MRHWAGQYKGRVACDGDTLRLRCKKNHRLAIYTAMYGRGQDGSLECPSNIPQPHNECRSPSALQRIIQQCQGKPRCVLEADSGEYGDPCPRGTRKYISVIYTCVPRQVLVDISWLTFPLSGDHSFVGDSGFPPGQPSYIPSPSTKKYDLVGEEGAVVVPGREQDGKQPEKPQVREVLKDNPVIVEVPYGGIMEEATVTLSPYIPATAPDGLGNGQPAKLRVFSDILATYGYIRDNPEKALLYFILGICSGILLLLFGLIFKLTCFSGQDRQQKESSQEFSSQEEENSEEQEHDEHDHRTERRPEAIEVVRWNGRDYTRHNHTLNHSHPGMHHELDEPPGTRSLNRYYP